VRSLTLLCGVALVDGAAVAASSDLPAGVISYDIHPTAQLTNSNLEDGHRLLQDMDYKHAVYGPLEYFDSDAKDDFDEHRHLSRFERAEKKAKRNLAATDQNKDLYQVTPLFQGYGTHYATVWVGTPPQRKSVIVDTGSHFTAFPCVGCKNCGEEHHTDSYFDPSKSSTFRQLNCDECEGTSRCQKDPKSGDRCVFNQSYTEGSSWSAYQAKDRFFCGSNDVNTAPTDRIDNSFATPFMFGCQTSETGLFVTQLADGIMGMSAHPTTLVKQMFDKAILARNMFSMCFKRELSPSKEGMTAGILTLGGVDTRLNTSPMVYAKNVSPSGWYTVNVKNIFLRKGGGVSAGLDINNENKAQKGGNRKLQKGEELIVRLPFQSKSVNSGKGVIIDSGTTDTYLSKTLAEDFGKSWKEITGMPYSNTALKLSKDAVDNLPTLLLQFEGWGFDEKGENDLMLGMQGAVGLVGALDPENPGDVLIAIPASHFMEYSPSKDTYTSRLYFTETRGGVIGANAMQGHDVLFDWENERVGIAESTCDYSQIKEDLDNFKKEGGNVVEGADEGHEKSVDCVVSEPFLSQSCVDSVDVAKVCPTGPDPNLKAHGAHKKFALVVEKIGSGMKGKNCHQVASEKMNNLGALTCSMEGTCTALIPCHITCQELLKEAKNKPMEVEQGAGTGAVNEGQCGDNTWGACTTWCSQSRVQSVLMDDGICHEDESKVESRPCHIDACGSHDPCRIPFVVHAVVGLANIQIDLWNKRQEEIFVSGFADSLNGLGGIGPGDIEVMIANKWMSENGADLLGLKLVLEISIFNSTTAEKTYTPPNGGELAEDLGVAGKLFGKLESELSSAEVIANCEEEDLYTFANTALELHNKIQHNSFMPFLLRNLPTPPKGTKSPFNFSAVASKVKEPSRVISSWTIMTKHGTVHDHSYDHTLSRSSRFSKKQLKKYVTDFPFMAAFTTSVIFLLGIGAYFGVKWETRRGRKSVLKPTVDKLKELGAAPSKGKYARVQDNNLDGDVEMA